MDIATLGLRIENGQAVQAAQQTGAALDQLAAKGDRAVASTSRIEVALKQQATQTQNLQSWMRTLREQFDLTNASSAESVLSFQKHVTALAQMTAAYGSAGAAARAEADALMTQVTAQREAAITAEQAAAAQTAAAGASGMHGLQLGRLNMELGTFIGRATGANTAATRLGAMIGGNVIGYAAMIGVLVGVSGLLWIWEKLTGDTKKAREEQDRLTESLEKWYDTQKRGVGAERQRELEAETATVARLTREYTALSEAADAANASRRYGGANVGAGVGLIVPGVSSSDEAALAQKKAALAAGYADLAKLRRDAALKERADMDDELAHAVEYFKADGDLREKAVARQKDLEGQLAYLRQSHPTDLADINALVDSIQKLDQALNPTTKKDPEIAKQAREATQALKELEAASQRIADQAYSDATNAAAKAAQLRVEVDQEQRLLAAKKQGADAVDALTVAIAGENAARDMEGHAMPQQIADVVKLAEAKARLAIEIRNVEESARAEAESIQKTIEEEIKAYKKSMEDQKKAAEKYAVDMEHIWASGFDRIITNGTKSFQNFFDDVLQLFNNLLRKMEEAGKTSGGMYKLLGIGSAAIGGGVAGYQIGTQAGQSTGSLNGALLGAAGGAASGAMLGSMVLPGLGTAIGAIVGGLAGLAGGLLGGSAAAKQRRDEEDKLRQSLQASVDAIKLQLGLITPLNAALDANAMQFRQLRDEVDKAYAGRKNQQEREAKLRELNDLEQQAAQKLRDDATKQAVDAANQLADAERAQADAARQAAEQTRRYIESLLGRAGAATGNAAGASLGLFDAGQRQEFSDARTGGKSAVELQLLAAVQGIERTNFLIDQQEQAVNDANAKQQAALDAQVQAAQAQVSLLQTSITTQQQLVDATQKVVESLSAFQDSLKLNTSLTTLSPADQLAEARRQYDQTLAQAMGGNATAAGNLPGLAQSLLTASHAYNASGTGYVADFQRVQDTVAQVQARFGTQLSVEQLILQALQNQLGTLQSQIDALNAAKAQAQADAAAQIAKLEQTRADAQSAAAAQIAALQAQLAALLAISHRFDPSTPPTPTPNPSDPPQFDPLAIAAAITTLSAKVDTLTRVAATVGTQQVSGLTAIQTKLEENTSVTRTGFELVAVT